MWKRWAVDRQRAADETSGRILIMMTSTPIPPGRLFFSLATISRCLVGVTPSEETVLTVGPAQNRTDLRKTSQRAVPQLKS